MDYNNKLADCPPFVRVTQNNLEKVNLDSYKCVRCEHATRDIINLNCMHCYMCYECFKKKKDKFKCNVCGKKVEKLVRIYVTTSL